MSHFGTRVINHQTTPQVNRPHFSKYGIHIHVFLQLPCRFERSQEKNNQRQMRLFSMDYLRDRFPQFECKTTNLEISILRKYKKDSRLLFHLWTITLGSLSLVPTSWRLRKTKRRKTSIISLSTWEIEYQQFKLIRFTIPQKPPWCCIQFSPGSWTDHLAIRFIDASVWHMNERYYTPILCYLRASLSRFQNQRNSVIGDQVIFLSSRKGISYVIEIQRSFLLQNQR